MQKAASLVNTSVFKTFTTKDDFLREFDRFAPLVNNWAINDFMCCRIKPIKKFFAEFYAHLESYVMSSSPWYNRIAIVCMLDWYLTDEYIEDVFLRLSKITSDDYYVEMAKAWLYATAYIKLPDYTEDYLKRTLAISQSTLSKTLQKIRDSRRVPKNKKEELTKYFS